MIKLNIGCGWRNFGNDWVHIDGGNYEHLDHQDVSKLPYEDNTVDLIYSSHMIEYFDRKEVIDVIKEWHRVLKPNGILRIAVPNFSTMCWLYENGNINLNQILGPLYGKMKMKDNFSRKKLIRFGKDATNHAATVATSDFEHIK